MVAWPILALVKQRQLLRRQPLNLRVHAGVSAYRGDYIHLIYSFSNRNSLSRRNAHFHHKPDPAFKLAELHVMALLIS